MRKPRVEKSRPKRKHPQMTPGRRRRIEIAGAEYPLSPLEEARMVALDGNGPWHSSAMCRDLDRWSDDRMGAAGDPVVAPDADRSDPFHLLPGAVHPLAPPGSRGTRNRRCDDPGRARGRWQAACRKDAGGPCGS